MGTKDFSPPDVASLSPNEDFSPPDVASLSPNEGPIQRIENATRRVVLERPDSHQRRFRDVHRKTNGVVWGWFVIRGGLDPRLARGVFATGDRHYSAWIRFSSSNKRAQSDAVPDGRGIAIKLLGVAGMRLPQVNQEQSGTQDFILLNGPAFFAANAQSMAEAAELEANDQFPSSFFLSRSRLAGLAALLRMSSAQADSPLDLTYYSQTPYKLGANSGTVVKYRLKPQPPRRREKREGTKGGNYLFEALKEDLRPNGNVSFDFARDASDIVFDFEVQLKRDGYPVDDDATAVWSETDSPFIRVAELRIPRQVFATTDRMTVFGENMSYNPWNGLADHEPVGSINEARRVAYEASRSTRHALNVPEPDYRAEWANRMTAATRGNEWTPPDFPSPSSFVSGWRAMFFIFPKFGKFLLRILSSPWGYVLAAALLAAGVGYGFIQEAAFKKKAWFNGPIVLGAGLLPSEAAIPPAQEARTISADDVVWKFRYASVGAEAEGGTPYWIFRALPRIVPEAFAPTGDYSAFGLVGPDDQTYYTDYHGLPRGTVLTEPIANVGGNQFGFGIKLVTFNCATCHRGEYLDRSGNSHFVDGMPNLSVDTAAYKKALFGALRDNRFNVENVIAAIDSVLLDDSKTGRRLPDGGPMPTALNAVERVIYAGIVSQAKKRAWAKPLEWMDHRPRNGPGRLDAFGALRFEFLGFEADWPPDDVHIATVDLPSIWHQGPKWRPSHHYDGNTDRVRARNFGAIIGIGGIPVTLRKGELDVIGKWIDEKLAPPEYPFRDELAPAQIAEGKEIFEAQCSSCHGKYASDGHLVAPTDCMKAPEKDVGTDDHRYKSIDDKFVKRLNDFGAANMVWDQHAFVPGTGYLCPPLDGIWARAPYLHNGSVPTLFDLLGPVEKNKETGDPGRPTEFVRGNPEYDREKGGFVTTPRHGRPQFTFHTGENGNSAKGHDDRRQVIEKTGDRKAVIAYLLSL